jgi:hypothetical protein
MRTMEIKKGAKCGRTPWHTSKRREENGYDVLRQTANRLFRLLRRILLLLSLLTFDLALIHIILDLFQIPIDSTCSREYDHASLHDAHTNALTAVATCDSVLAGYKAFNSGEQPAVKAAKPQLSNRNKLRGAGEKGCCDGHRGRSHPSGSGLVAKTCCKIQKSTR